MGEERLLEFCSSSKKQVGEERLLELCSSSERTGG